MTWPDAPTSLDAPVKKLLERLWSVDQSDVPGYLPGRTVCGVQNVAMEETKLLKMTMMIRDERYVFLLTDNDNR